MNVVKIFPYPGAEQTTAFGWDKGPSLSVMKLWTQAKRDEAARVWPRFHVAEDRSLRWDILAALGFAWVKYPIICPVDAEYAEYHAADSEGVSVLRLMGPWWEFRIKHMIGKELSREAVPLIADKKPIPAGTKLGPPGNVGLSFGAGNSEGRHIHCSFLAWSDQAEFFFSNQIGPFWNVDDMANIVKANGRAVLENAKKRGIDWISRTVACKRNDPFLKHQCYEAAPSAIGA